MKRNLKLITAFADNLVIGRKLDLPWKVSADLKRVKELTTGKTIFMGSNTYASLGNKPLPNRTNIVVDFNKEHSILHYDIATTVVFYNDLEKALTRLNENTFIFGGASIYKQCLPYVDTMYITRIYATIEGEDLFYFPEINYDEWNLVEQSEVYPADSKNEYPYQFLVYKRKDNS